MIVPVRESDFSLHLRTPAMAVTFTTETPVLPLPLLGVRRDSLQMDVIVIGDTSFRSDVLRLESTFRCDKIPYTVAQLRKDNVPPTHLGACSIYALEGLPNLRIGLPEITKSLWDGCVLTRFSGEIRPSKEADELRLHAEPASSSFRVTSGHPRIILLKRMFRASLVGLIWMTGICLLVIFSKLGNHKALLASLILCVIPISLGMGIAHCSRVQPVNEKTDPWQRNQPTDYLDVLVKGMSEISESAGKDAYGINSRLRDLMRQSFPPVDREEDWYQIFEDDRGLICRIYDVRDDLACEPRRLGRIVPYAAPLTRAKNPVWPAPDPRLTFIGEPTDIVLVEKSSQD